MEGTCKLHTKPETSEKPILLTNTHEMTWRYAILKYLLSMYMSHVKQNRISKR